MFCNFSLLIILTEFMIKWSLNIVLHMYLFLSKIYISIFSYVVWYFISIIIQHFIHNHYIYVSHSHKMTVLILRIWFIATVICLCFNLYEYLQYSFLYLTSLCREECINCSLNTTGNQKNQQNPTLSREKAMKNSMMLEI